MFIAHGEWVRKHSRWILGGILLLLIPGFIALFTTTGGSARRETELPTVRGKPVDVGRYEKARGAVVAEFLMNTGRQPQRSPEFDDRVKQQAVLRLVMLEKAKAAGIRVADEDLAQQIRIQPLFRSEGGQFDQNRYRQFLIFLNNYGISEQRFEEIMREELMLQQIESQIAATAKVTPGEVELVFTPMHEKLSVELAEFNTEDYKEPVTVTDEEAKAFYDQNQQSFLRPAQVKVRYARFPFEAAKKSIKLSDEEISEFYERNKMKYADTNNVAKPADTNNVAKPLESVRKEVEEDLLALRAERAAGDRATELTVKLVHEPGQAKTDFTKACAGFDLKPQETDFFGQRDKVPGIEAGVEFNRAAFALSPDAPFSDPVPGTNAFYVLEYVDSRPSEIPPFEQIKKEVVDQVKRTRIYDATIKKGRDAHTKVKEAMAAGKSFAEACAALKVKVQSPPPFTLSDEKPTLPGGGRIQQSALGLSTNTVSDFVQTTDGGLFFYLKDRQPPDREEFEKNLPKYMQQLLQRNRQALVQDWVSSLVRQEQINFGRMRRPQQPAEPEEEAPAPAPAPSPS